MVEHQPSKLRVAGSSPVSRSTPGTVRFSRPAPGPRTLAVELDERLGQARDFQDVLDIVRAWTADRSFQLGVQMLHGTLRPDAAGPHLSDLAETALRVVYRAVEEAFADTHGRVPGADLAIVAMGKFGGREMSVDSDLDLMVIEQEVADKTEYLRLRKAIGRIGTGVDVLIYSEDEAMRRSQVPGTVLYWAVKEGKVLHDGLA